MLSLLLPATAKALSVTDTIASNQKLKEVTVTGTRGVRSLYRTENVDNIGQQQLARAACCNLGESFTTNPSVDVNYSDAATGARQIKLLGLSGTYVQMMTENMPNLRGASLPYSLGYTPGPWMQSIQVSKGASSVKNGYESTTGQINIEYLKPQATDGVRGNVYYDSQQRLEANADGSIHLNSRLSTSLLMHYEDRQSDHDGNNDGFMDMPKLRQYNIMNRWAYVSPRFISQLFVRFLNDNRESGQSYHHAAPLLMPHYGIEIAADRYEIQWKNAIITNADRNASVALMLHGSYHDADHTFGERFYDVTQKNGYAQLMYETDIAVRHNISLGASLNHDYYNELYNSILDINDVTRGHDGETTTGIYGQYTYKIDDILTVMAGLRCDNSTRFGTFVTPRVHLKYAPTGWFTIRASAGKGYRSSHALAENVSLLASGRHVYYANGASRNMKQEEAWNFGTSLAFNIPIAEKNLEVNAEYYYTTFLNQMVVNVRPTEVVFGDLDGQSYSHTLQIDATYPFFEGFTATGAFRYVNAQTTYDGVLHLRPLTSRYKGLLTMSYKTPLELWHFDLTGQLNGGGELYDHTSYPAYFQLQAQVTRDFRRFSVYAGGENLTNYRMKNPILFADNPWSAMFDATQVWGPTDGAMFYVGLRFKFE